MPAAARKRTTKTKPTAKPAPHLSMVPKESAYHRDATSITTTPGVDSVAIITAKAPPGADQDLNVRLKVSLPIRGWEIANGQALTAELILRDAMATDGADNEPVYVYLEDLEELGAQITKLGKEAKLLGLLGDGTLPGEG